MTSVVSDINSVFRAGVQWRLSSEMFQTFKMFLVPQKDASKDFLSEMRETPEELGQGEREGGTPWGLGIPGTSSYTATLPHPR